ncbi:hypothetical protein NDU88_011484 [Pleurodeles waltl]|uniref:WAP domain-containing protein n=1 Tax=Pleurodeles waltl TaxID=8319 RepID=A0AAV7S1A6_PLEWA|nr:hypothetical protein NDU88_011484 [Pleurodeles waltl]
MVGSLPMIKCTVAGLMPGVTACVNPKPGRCQNITPVLCFAPDLNNCESDGDCPRDQKCCNLPCGYGCTDPQTVNPKPGRCQNITPVLCFAPDLNNCESDGDCPRDQKCCNLPCGYGCTDPQTGNISRLLSRTARPFALFSESR